MALLATIHNRMEIIVGDSRELEMGERKGVGCPPGFSLCHCDNYAINILLGTVGSIGIN